MDDKRKAAFESGNVRAVEAAAALYAGAVQAGASEAEARMAAEEYLNPTMELLPSVESWSLPPGTKDAAIRLAKTSGIVALNVVPYAIGVVPGLVVTGVTVGLVAPTSYYERQAQFMELTGEPLFPSEAVAIVIGDVSGASAVYLIASGEDILTASPVDAGVRVEMAAHLAVGLGAAKATSLSFPAIRTGVAIADQASASGLLYLEQGYSRLTAAAFDARPGQVILGSGISPGPITGRQLLFPFAEPTPPQVVFRVLRPEENPQLGLFAKNPMSSTTLETFIQRGSTLETRFISTTRDINVARLNARRTGNRIVAIDLSKVNPQSIIDLSSEAARAAVLTNPRAINFAQASSEVVITEIVPPEAITPIIPTGVPR